MDQFPDCHPATCELDLVFFNFFMDTVVKPRYDKVDFHQSGNYIVPYGLITICGSSVLLIIVLFEPLNISSATSKYNLSLVTCLPVVYCL